MSVLGCLVKSIASFADGSAEGRRSEYKRKGSQTGETKKSLGEANSPLKD